VKVNDEREELIRRIIENQRGVVKAFSPRQSPLFASNLTMRQLTVVMLVAVKGSATGQELSHHLGVALGTVTGIVDRLVAHGLVSRHEDPHDRRVRRVELTEAGTKLVDRINDAGLQQYQSIMSHLDTEMLRCLHKVTGRLREVAEDLYGK
jgi:DNA-binding MarR family transcriptional regulator